MSFLYHNQRLQKFISTPALNLFAQPMPQDDLTLKLENGTMDWSRRLKMTMFGMCIEDICLDFKGCRREERSGTQADFYMMLAEELVDNTFEVGVRLRGPRNTIDSDATINKIKLDGVSLNLTTRRRRQNRIGELQTGRLQGRCQVCKNKLIWCAQFAEKSDHNRKFICVPPRLVLPASSHTWPTSSRCGSLT